MRSIFPLAICLWLSACLCSGTLAADRKDSTTGRWTGFTVDQLAKHLGLEGGNIDLAFKTPVYLNIQLVTKDGADQPIQIPLDTWTDKPSTNYKLYVRIEELDRSIDEMSVKYRIEYTRIDREPISEPGVRGQRIHDTGAGYGGTLVVEAKRWTRGGEWRNLSTKLSIDEPVVIYELSDSDAREDNYRKLIVRFADSLPPSKEEEEPRHNKAIDSDKK